MLHYGEVLSGSFLSKKRIKTIRDAKNISKRQNAHDMCGDIGWEYIFVVNFSIITLESNEKHVDI